MPRRNRLLSDLVRDSKIETEFIDPEVVEHVFYETGRSARHRRVRNVERWTKGRQLGQGAYGTVHLQTCQDGAVIRSRAVKEVKKFVITGQELDYASELEAIMKFSHSKYRHCFVISDGWYELGDTIFITMEYFELGDLQQYITAPLPESETLQIVDQVLEGLEFMHDNSFIHRDLKPANIIVVDKSQEWFVKIADFGISRRRHNDTTSLTMQLGTLGFVAPEVIGSDSDKSYTYSVDMWSLGAMTYRILTSKMAFQGLDSMFKYVLGNMEFPTAALKSLSVSENALDFISSLMQPDPEARPSAESAAKHLWITSPLTSEGEKETAHIDIINHERSGKSGISTASKMWSMPSGSNEPLETTRQQPSPVMERLPGPTDDETSASASWYSNESDSETSGQTSHQMVIRPREPDSKPEPEPESAVTSNANDESESENNREREALDEVSSPINETLEGAEVGIQTNYKSPYVETDEDEPSTPSKPFNEAESTRTGDMDGGSDKSKPEDVEIDPEAKSKSHSVETDDDESSVTSKLSDKHFRTEDEEADNSWPAGFDISRKLERRRTRYVESSEDEFLTSSKPSDTARRRTKERGTQDPSQDDDFSVSDSNEQSPTDTSESETDEGASAECMVCKFNEKVESAPSGALRDILTCLHDWRRFPKLNDGDFEEQHFCPQHSRSEDVRTSGNLRSAIKHIEAQKEWAIRVKFIKALRQTSEESNLFDVGDVVCCSCPREYSGHRAPFMVLPCGDCRGFICRKCHNEASGIPSSGRSAHRAWIRFLRDDSAVPLAPLAPLDGGCS